MKSQNVFKILLSLLALVIVGCGGGGGGGGTSSGGGGTQYTQATVTVSLAGAGTIGAATIVIDNALNKGLGTPVFTKTGIGVTPVPDIFVNDTSIANKDTMDIEWDLGTAAGTVATLVYPITAGSFPQATDFTINLTDTVINDLIGDPLATVTAHIDVTFQ